MYPHPYNAPSNHTEVIAENNACPAENSPFVPTRERFNVQICCTFESFKSPHSIVNNASRVPPKRGGGTVRPVIEPRTQHEQTEPPKPCPSSYSATELIFPNCIPRKATSTLLGHTHPWKGSYVGRSFAKSGYENIHRYVPRHSDQPHVPETGRKHNRTRTQQKENPDNTTLERREEGTAKAESDESKQTQLVKHAAVPPLTVLVQSTSEARVSRTRQTPTYVIVIRPVRHTNTKSTHTCSTHACARVRAA